MKKYAIFVIIMTKEIFMKEKVKDLFDDKFDKIKDNLEEEVKEFVDTKLDEFKDTLEDKVKDFIDEKVDKLKKDK